MRIEPYYPKYFNKCMEIIKSNIPKYISYNEHLDYENYLYREDKIYFVLLEKSNLIACGGYGVHISGTKIGLSWGMVHNEQHNKGYGSELLKFRLNHIKNNYPDTEIHLDTSQYTYRFFEKFGFNVTQILKNRYADGLDRYVMILK